MKDRHLDRLLWRCEYGRVAPEVVALELQECLQRARDGSIDVRDSATVRLWDEALLSEYDTAFQGARRTLELGRLRAALQQIHRCERVVASMRALAGANDDIERAAEAMERIHELAGTAHLRRLPAVASLAQIVDLARQCLLERRFPQGSHIARICLRLANTLAERCSLFTGESIAMQERLSVVGELCRATRPFVDRPDEEPTDDGTLTTLQSLFDRRYAALSMRLLSELEVECAGRRRFLLHLQRKQHGGAAILGDLDAVRAIVRERSWDGAVDHYWHLSVSTHTGVLQEQWRRVVAVSAEIRNGIASQEETHERGESDG